MGTSSSSDELLPHILKNSEGVIINGGMCIFFISSVGVRFGILVQMKCSKVIKKMNRKYLQYWQFLLIDARRVKDKYFVDDDDKKSRD